MHQLGRDAVEPFCSSTSAIADTHESSQPHLEAGNGLPALVIGQPSLCLPLQGHCRKLELLDCDVSRPNLHAQGAGDISGRPMLWSTNGTDSIGLLWDKSATLCTGKED